MESLKAVEAAMEPQQIVAVVMQAMACASIKDTSAMKKTTGKSSLGKP